MVMELLSLGVTKKLFDADAVAAPVNGTAYCLPAPPSSKTIRWTTKFASAPSAVSVKLQGSLDNSVWFDLDSSTSTAGESKSVTDIACVFIRAQKASQTDGGALTVEIIISLT